MRRASLRDSRRQARGAGLNPPPRGAGNATLRAPNATSDAARLFLILIALLLPGGASAGRRVAAVVPGCRSELATLKPDVDGDEDRCVASVVPRCGQAGSLALDVEGLADRCVASAGSSPSGATREPDCPAGLELEAREQADACRGAEKPTCPQGLKLRALKGDDICRK